MFNSDLLANSFALHLRILRKCNMNLLWANNRKSTVITPPLIGLIR